MSSDESTAAPWRANAFSASLFPAPIPPVTAIATGREVPLKAPLALPTSGATAPPVRHLK